MEYTRVDFSSDIEKKILTGMIISDSYIRDISIMINPKFFKIDYIKKIVGWVMAYHKQYKRAPGKDFESIFYAKAEKLKKSELEIMEEFLSGLNDQYISDRAESFPFNQELLFDQTVSFCRDRQIEILQKTIEGYRLEGNFNKAEELIANYGNVAKQTSQWVNPLDTEEVYKTFEEDEENKLFKLPGALGELIGFLQRGWLLGIMGPAKRGKSWYEWEIVFHALCARLKVAIFSFEMNKTVYKKRIYSRMTAMAANGGEYAYPIFDCAMNQDNSCNRQERTNTVILNPKENRIDQYSSASEYRACTACRGTKSFYPTVWWQTQNQKEGISEEAIIKKTKTFKKLYGNNLRIRCFPSFSAGFEEADAELEVLKRQGFEPDVIAYDYFDIMSSEVANELEDENRKWKKGKGVAGLRHCLVINCHQGNRESEEKSSMRQKHTGGNIKKLQHLDVDITLNQNEIEKKQGIMRIGVLVNRHEEGIEKGEVVALQSLKLGQPLIDSEWKRERRIKDAEVK